MTRQFTKYEAAGLLGETVECKKTFTEVGTDLESNTSIQCRLKVGDKAEVVLLQVDQSNSDISLGLLVEGHKDIDYVLVNKKQFDLHCLAIGPGINIESHETGGFTEQEIAALLGKSVECKETFKLDHTNEAMASNALKKGAIGYVSMFDSSDTVEGVFVSLEFGDYEYISLHKKDFERYISILMPVDFSDLPLTSIN